MRRRARLRERFVLAAIAAGIAAGSLVAPALSASADPGSVVVPVGASPVSLAFSPDNRQAFVANADSSTVSVIDVASRAVTTTIPVPPTPFGVLVAPDDRTVFVTSSGTNGTDGGVSVIDAVQEKVIRWIPLDGRPGGMAIRPGTTEVWIANLEGQMIPVLDWRRPTTPTLVYMPFSESGRFTFSPDGQKLFATQFQQGVPFSFGEYDFPNGAWNSWDQATQPSEIAYSPDGTHQYQVHASGVFDQDGRAYYPGGYGGAIAFRPDSSQLFLVGPSVNGVTSVAAFDPLRRTVDDTYPVGSLPADLAVSPDGSLLASVNAGDGTVSLITLPPEAAPPGLAVDRISGANRFEVSAALSQQGFPSGAPVAYLASGLGFADALSAAPAAVKAGGPVLLTPPGYLPDVIRAELVRLHPSRIVIVGGPAVIGDPVRVAAARIAAVSSVWGGDRYATSRAVIDDAFGTASTMLVASGENFPDALSAGAAAAKIGAPVLLIPGHSSFPEYSADPDYSDFLARHAVTALQFVGGPGSITDAAMINGTFESRWAGRIWGPDRYATSIAVNSFGFTSASHVFIASGTGYADALGGSALAGSASSPLYVVPPGCIPGSLFLELQRLSASRLTLIGGPAALAPSVEQLAVCGG